MNKTWRVSMRVLEVWAEWRLIYLVSNFFKLRLEIVSLIGLTNMGNVVEFIDIGPDGSLEQSNISRACLENLALSGHARDNEMDVDYYTKDINHP